MAIELTHNDIYWEKEYEKAFKEVLPFLITEKSDSKALISQWVADYYRDKYEDEEMNDYDKTDMDYKNLAEGNDCQPKNNWLTHPMLDLKVVAEGERFLTNRMENQVATKSTMPKGSKPVVAHKVNYYDVGGISTISFIKAKLTQEQYKGFLLGNILKYSSRLQYKGDVENDAKKLAEYSKWLEEEML